MSEEDGQCIRYAEEEKQPQKVEETEKDLNQSQGELWEASAVSSVPTPWFILMPLMSYVRYQFDHLLVCHYAKLLRLSLKLILMAEQGEWILTEFRIMTDNQKVFYA